MCGRAETALIHAFRAGESFEVVTAVVVGDILLLLRLLFLFCGGVFPDWFSFLLRLVCVLLPLIQGELLVSLLVV